MGGSFTDHIALQEALVAYRRAEALHRWFLRTHACGFVHITALGSERRAHVELMAAAAQCGWEINPGPGVVAETALDFARRRVAAFKRQFGRA